MQLEQFLENIFGFQYLLYVVANASLCIRDMVQYTITDMKFLFYPACLKCKVRRGYFDSRVIATNCNLNGHFSYDKGGSQIFAVA